MAFFRFFSSNIRKGMEKIRGNPQLIYTAAVALLIAGAFIFVADRFVSIATDAGDRLINVRIGSIQDAFVAFAGDRMGDTRYLDKKIQEIVQDNETIQDFRIVTKADLQNASGGPSYRIIASADPKDIGADAGANDQNIALLYTLAAGQPGQSFTVQEQDPATGDRLFKTARAIADAGGAVIAVTITTQRLSQADKAINDNITGSMILLVIILVLIMLLFLRHSRIIDYMSLYKKLKDVDQLKDDFISMASHELRTPLTAIRGYSEFIREAKDLSPETKDYAGKIDVSARALDGLVADILDVSRIEQGRLSLNMRKIDPTPVIKGVVDSLSIEAKDRGLALSFVDDTASSPVYIQADPDRLRQVLINFIGNAVKYTFKGQVLVRQYAEKRSRGAFGDRSSKLIIQVQDTGIGMNASDQKRLFEKFYRIRSKDTEGIPGTGLGLWITRQIVLQMQGDISVESIEGVGSKFTLSFNVLNKV